VVRIDGPCPLLRHGRCTVYDARPMICRLWGLDDFMVCPHGCEPEKRLTHAEAIAFMARVKDIEDRAGDDAGA
jgi:Fe-S-cluster containining protein